MPKAPAKPIAKPAPATKAPAKPAAKPIAKPAPATKAPAKPAAKPIAKPPTRKPTVKPDKTG